MNSSQSKTLRRILRELDTVNRFLIKIRVSQSGCWIWIGCINDKKSEFPYGRFRFRGKMQYAHRVSYYLFRGPLHRDKEILHSPTCESESCVNPFHLTQGSHSTNMRKEWQRKYYGAPRPIHDPFEVAARVKTK